VHLESFEKGDEVMKRIPLAAVALLVSASLVHAATVTATGTTKLSVTVSNEASITITTGTTTLTATGTTFNPYTGTTNFTYKIRTTQTTGSGSIVLQVTQDFSPAGGPSVGTPPSAGDALTYTCSTASGTPCSSAQTASTTAQTGVATFGADAHSVSTSGDAGSVTWSLTNDPKYKTGTYTNAIVTFTISAA
jgi:hypothetical protein